MYGVMSPSVSPGSSHRFTSVTWIPSVIVPSCAARAGAAPARSTTAIITARTNRPTLIRHLHEFLRSVRWSHGGEARPCCQANLAWDTLAPDGDPAARAAAAARARVLLSGAGTTRSARPLEGRAGDGGRRPEDAG